MTPEPAPGHPEIVRVVAPNPGPMTLGGTNTYVVGPLPEAGGEAYVIDPGPADPAHAEAVRAAAAERGGIAGVLLTHSHADHSGAVPLLGAPLLWGEVSDADEGAWAPGEPSPQATGRTPSTRTGPFELVPTPGHSRDHVCLLHGGACFCGDLILGQGSSIVPPDGGSLTAYLDSLSRVLELAPRLLCPGHGPWVTDPAAKIDEYVRHRAERERRLVAALAAGERSRARLLEAVWDDVPAPLRPAAAVAMETHLEKLRSEGHPPEGLEA